MNKHETEAGVPLERSANELYELAANAGIPGYMQEGLVRYVVNHRPTGGFLTAVLSNDLKRACSSADDENKIKIWSYAFWLFNYAPQQCWGSPENVDAWLELGKKERERRAAIKEDA